MLNHFRSYQSGEVKTLCAYQKLTIKISDVNINDHLYVCKFLEQISDPSWQ